MSGCHIHRRGCDIPRNFNSQRKVLEVGRTRFPWRREKSLPMREELERKQWSEYR
jgi:hypothetical protein